jgi:hypothetical protein
MWKPGMTPTNSIIGDGGMYLPASETLALGLAERRARQSEQRVRICK